jgi:hypothetical protein
LKYISIIFLLPIFILCFFLSYADDESINLKQILIQGNRRTQESYIRSFLTIEEEKVYELDDLFDEINKSRENLERTQLFTSIFFNDQLDEFNNLTIIVQIREKNYFYFGLTGYMGFEDKEFYSTDALYIEYINLFGNSSRLYVETPFYKDYGIMVRYSGIISPLLYVLGFEFRIDDFFDQIIYNGTAGMGYEIGKKTLVELDVALSREKDRENSSSQTSIVFLPSIDYGYNERYTTKIKKWSYFQLAPYIGYNIETPAGTSDTDVFYGIKTNLNFYRDLLLKIVYSTRITLHYQDGGVPNNYLVSSDIRGTYFDANTGDWLVSLSNELNIPWPLDERINFVPFFDAGLIGAPDADFLSGGGLGLHLYTKYQDPIIIEVAFGKGFMLNFSKRY